VNTVRSLLLAAAVTSGAFAGPTLAEPMHAEPMHVAIAALPLEHLKLAYLGCDRAATDGTLDLPSFQRCVFVGDELLRRGFDGDFDRLIAWWRVEKVRFARAEPPVAAGR
jgi:hypothetical protein